MSAMRASPPAQPVTVAASALVDATGAVEEVGDGRGRRLLERDPALVAYAVATLGCSVAGVRFIWAPARESWWSVHVTCRSDGEQPLALLEAVAVEPPHGLTLRELDVLTLVAGGLSNPEIAGHLGASTRTVSTHVEHVLRKLERSSRAGAAALAVDQGLLRLPIPGGGRSVEGLAVGLVDETAAGSEPRGRRPAYRTDTLPRTRPRPYLIGSAFPLSGAGRHDGVEMRNGSSLAVDDINARGGIAGRSVEQLVVDVDVDSEAGIEAAMRRLVEAEVDAITTGYWFADHRRGYEVVAAYGCPLLSSLTVESAAEWVRDEHERLGGIFQVCPTEIHYGTGFVRFLDELAGAGTWRPANRRLVFVDTPTAGGQTAGHTTLEAAERSGWTVDAILTVANDAADWTTTLRQLRASAPAAVMISHFVAAEMAAFQHAFVAEPTDTLVYGVFAPAAHEFLDRAGASAEGLVWATVTGHAADRFGTAFTERYRDAFGARPGLAMAGLSYDQVNLLTSAWGRVSNPRAFAAVGAELRRAPLRGVNGTYVLGHARQCGLAYPDETPDPSLGQSHLVFQVQDGRHRMLGPGPYAESSFRTPPWFSGTP